MLSEKDYTGSRPVCRQMPTQHMVTYEIKHAHELLGVPRLGSQVSGQLWPIRWHISVSQIIGEWLPCCTCWEHAAHS